MAIWKKKAKVRQSLHWGTFADIWNKLFFFSDWATWSSHLPRNEQELYCPRHGPILNSCHMHIASNSLFWQAPTFPTHQEHHQPFIFCSRFIPCFTFTCNSFFSLAQQYHIPSWERHTLHPTEWMNYWRLDHPQMAFNSPLVMSCV